MVSELPRPADDFAGAMDRSGARPQGAGHAARNFYARPDERVHFTGITGTNGKTTTAYLIDAILREAGMVTGLIGTIEYRLAGEARKAPNTTPESLDIMRFAAELEQRGGTHLTIGSFLARRWRWRGFTAFEFHTAVFTNLTRDHLDFHRTMEEYAAAKRLLFVPRRRARAAMGGSERRRSGQRRACVRRATRK